MCKSVGASRRDAAEMLAKIINEEFGANTAADDVRRVFGAHWHPISTLAHIVHDEVAEQTEHPAATVSYWNPAARQTDII